MGELAGLPALRQALDQAYRIFRNDPSYTNFDMLQQAMTIFQSALNTWTVEVGA
jgi:hypothetical protein